MDAAFGNWLAGFIDGEGCFTIHRRRYAHKKDWYHCRFHLTVRADDAPIVEEIRDRLGIGILVQRRAGLSGPEALPQISWHIDKRADCVALAAFLTKYPLRAKKKRDFAIWQLALTEWCSRKKGSSAENMLAYKEALQSIRKYGGELDDDEEVALAPVSQLHLISP